MKKLVNVNTLSHTEWLKMRRKGIGGSDAGAVLGMNPWKSPVGVWMEKISEDEPEDKTNEAMRLGHDLEEYVAQRWSEETGKKVRKNNFMMAHNDHEYLIADIDREVVGENAILECKTASPYTWERWKDGNLPPWYTIQCLHYLMVTGAAKCYLACLIFGRGVEFREIERDEEAIQALMKAEVDFWESYVKTKEMPPADGSDASDEAIKTLYPVGDSELEAVDLPSSIDIAKYDEVNALISTLEAEKKTIEQFIKSEMKEAEIGYCGARRITWKTTKGRESVDTKRLKAEMPDVYEKYLKIGAPTRRFVVGKEEE